MKKGVVIYIGLFCTLVIFCINFWGPYNVLTAITANNIAEYKEIQQQLDGKILDIKYIGNHTYQVQTDKKVYVLMENSDYSNLKFKVFEVQKEIEIFKNPM